MTFWKCDGCGAEITERDRTVITVQDSWESTEPGTGFVGTVDVCPRCLAAVQDIVPSLTPYKKVP